jgi:hypothetical protein
MALTAPAPITRDGDRDAWMRAQIEKLRGHDWGTVDVDGLIDELEDMVGGRLDDFESALMSAIEHLLTLEYSRAADPRGGWMHSARAHRKNARRQLDRSPSLAKCVDLARLYADARDDVVFSFDRHGEAGADMLPHACPYTLEQVLDRGWYPENRHGLRSLPGEG